MHGLQFLYSKVGLGGTFTIYNFAKKCMRYCSSIEFFSVPNRTMITEQNYDQIFKSKFSKTTRQKFKINILSYRVNLALSEYSLTFNIFRVVLRILILEIDNVTIRFGDKFDRSAVPCEPIRYVKYVSAFKRPVFISKTGKSNKTIKSKSATMIYFKIYQLFEIF